MSDLVRDLRLCFQQEGDELHRRAADEIIVLLMDRAALRAENAALRERVERLEAAIDYVAEETGYYTPPQESEK